jgi:hypothetical protein
MKRVYGVVFNGLFYFSLETDDQRESIGVDLQCIGGDCDVSISEQHLN